MQYWRADKKLFADKILEAVKKELPTVTEITVQDSEEMFECPENSWALIIKTDRGDFPSPVFITEHAIIIGSLEFFVFTIKSMYNFYLGRDRTAEIL